MLSFAGFPARERVLCSSLPYPKADFLEPSYPATSAGTAAPPDPDMQFSCPDRPALRHSPFVVFGGNISTSKLTQTLEWRMNLAFTPRNSSATEEHLREEQLLREAWEEARLPIRDDRPEVLFWLEERKLEARNALIEHRRQFPESACHRASSGLPLFQWLGKWVHTSSMRFPPNR